MSLPPDAMRAFVELNATVDVDIYCFTRWRP